MIRICFFILTVLLPFHIFAQVTSNPAFPIETQAVTITFDSSKESRLGFFTSDLYAHTGVIVEGNTQWQHVIGSWGNNTLQPKLTNKGSGIYELEIAPDIRTFYSVLSSEKVKKIALVFRSADGTKQTNDILIDVFAEGLNVNISSPAKTNIFEKNESFTFTASTTSSADLKLFLNNQEIGSQTGTLITQTVTIPDAGYYWLKVKATQSATVKLDSVYVFIRETTPIESRPAGLQAGINYTDDQSATLIVYAPAKKNIFVIGDFNNWALNNSYQMKKDGDYFWLTIGNLVPKKNTSSNT